MAERTALTPKVLPGEYPGVIGANAADFTFVESDAANGNKFVSTGKEIIVAFNNGGSTFTITITSVNDAFRRTQHITDYSIESGNYSVFGPVPVSGWVQTDGNVYIDTNNSALKLVIFRIP